MRTTKITMNDKCKGEQTVCSYLDHLFLHGDIILKSGNSVLQEKFSGPLRDINADSPIVGDVVRFCLLGLADDKHGKEIIHVILLEFPLQDD